MGWKSSGRQQGRRTAVSLRWEGDVLVLVSTIEGPDPGATLSIGFRYELLDGGRRLRATEQLRGQGRDQDNVWVFDRR